MKPAHPQQAHACLQQLITSKPLFAIIDAAQDEQIIELLLKHDSHTPLQSLFEGEYAREMARIAPYLIQFDTPDHPLLESIVQLGWAQNWAVYFDYPSDFAAARHHLRQFIRVKNSSKEYMLFRFYDPRVFRKFIPTMDMSQLIAFYSAIGSYWLEDTDSQFMLRYQISDLQLDIQRMDIINKPHLQSQMITE